MEPYPALTSYQVSAVIMAGAKLGLFAALADGPATPDELAARLKLNPRATASLLRSLTALGFLEAHGHKFQLNATGALANQSGADGLVHLAHKEAFFYQLWTGLDEVVRTGQARLAPYRERLKTDPKFIETFLLALNDLAAKGAGGFLPAVPLGDAQRLLDVGGGAAGYACLLAERFTQLKITLLDLPEIVPLARRVVAEKKLTGRIDVVAGDVFAPGMGIGAADFDAVLVSHLLHDLDEASCRKILRQAFLAARSGGRLIVNDVFTGTGELKLPETFFDLMMQVENPGGASHPLAEVETWLRDAGWTGVTYRPLYFGGVLLAEKEAGRG